jgi:Spy/CpxP family protein refolding chaperone
MVMVGMVLTLLAAIGVSAWAQPASPATPGTAMDGGHRMHHGGMGGPGMMFGGSPERMGRMIDHMLDGLNASDAQRTQIKQIVAQAGADLKAGGGGARTAPSRHAGLHRLAVDANAAEQIRLQTMATTRRAGA